MFVLQSIEVILACSHKISRKGRYRKASERILTEKGEEKVDVTLYIKAGFRIGFLLFLLSAAWQDLRKKSIRASTFYIWGMMGCFGVYRSFTDCSRWFAKKQEKAGKRYSGLWQSWFWNCSLICFRDCFF